MVNSRHNILDIALAWRSQNDLADAFCLQVPRQSVAVPPDARVVDHEAVTNAVGFVIHIFRCICVNDLNLVAVCHKRLALLINANRALKHAMNRVSSQKARALQ